jgi:hypothetical protein
MGIDFRGMRMRLRARFELSRVRALLALLHFLKRVAIKFGSQDQREQFAGEWEAHEQKMDEKLRSLHRQNLFAHVGLALSHWAGVEEVFIGIGALLLRMGDPSKVGIIMYSVQFTTWVGIIDELFSLETRYLSLKPKWNKLSGRLRGLKETRDRLAHHTAHYNENAPRYWRCISKAEPL